MTAMTMPARPRSLLGKAITVAGRSAKARRRIAAAAAAVREHVTTIAAFASLDYGVFQLSHPAAWIAAAPLLLLAEWKVRD
jgi:hypothetical protein